LRRLAGRPPPEPRLIDRLAGQADVLTRMLFQDAVAGKLIVDRAGCVVRANTALHRMFGDGVTAVPGTPVLTLFAPADRPTIEQHMAAALATPTAEAAARPFVARLAAASSHGIGTADEPGATVSLVVAPLCEQDGSFSGAVLRVLDMSRSTRLEAELAHSQRVQAAGQLAGGIAHDFNNLLTAILGTADAIAGRAGIDDDTREDVAVIRATVERAAALARHLLEFGRRQALQPRVLAINKTLTTLANVLRRLLGSGIPVELALQQPGHFVHVDPAALDQVLLNLAVNARNAMPDGGRLTLRTGETTLECPLQHGTETILPGSYVMVEVQDTGCGIPPDVLPHIFEPFFTTRREDGGSGLGLSNVHDIVEQSDGFVAVESAPGQGTRMRVYLPRWDGERPAEAAPDGTTASRLVAVAVKPVPPLATPPPRRGALLLVDDEDVVRRVTERGLVRQGWQVLAAPTAEAALELLRDHPPVSLSAVVSDLVMPGMDGMALVRAVREHLAAPLLPAVFISGYAAQQVQERIARELGGSVTGFLAKPYDMKDLAAKLAEVVGAG
jgi:two-component system cell cycle sensor histidine kinase/response regulator CckA